MLKASCGYFATSRSSTGIAAPSVRSPFTLGSHGNSPRFQTDTVEELTSLHPRKIPFFFFFWCDTGQHEDGAHRHSLVLHLGLLSELPNKHPVVKSAPLTSSLLCLDAKRCGRYTPLTLLTKHRLFRARRLQLLFTLCLHAAACSAVNQRSAKPRPFFKDY